MSSPLTAIFSRQQFPQLLGALRALKTERAIRQAVWGYIFKFSQEQVFRRAIYVRNLLKSTAQNRGNFCYLDAMENEKIVWQPQGLLQAIRRSI